MLVYTGRLSLLAGRSVFLFICLSESVENGRARTPAVSYKAENTVVGVPLKHYDNGFLRKNQHKGENKP